MKLLKNILTILIVAITAILVFTFWAWQDLHIPYAHERKTITVASGSTLDQTIELLKSSGMIQNGLPLKIYVRFNGLGPSIKAGSYNFASPMSPLAVLAQLQKGGQAIDRLTVVEGWTKWDIANGMKNLPQLRLASAEEALELIDQTSSIEDLDPQATSLEGYLYPDTYFVDDNSKPKTLIATMVARFRQVYKTRLAAYVHKSKVSIHDLVTIASIIETEAKLPGERPMIASVIYNRLRQNIPLGMDSTLVYASKLAGAWKGDGKVYQSDVERQSPYNTYIHVGLPPGPVGAPGLSSLQAAIKPAVSSYTYYVRNPDRNDGAHNFYTNEADFQKGVAALRAWEKKQK
jgi:UPF0755 protein